MYFIMYVWVYEILLFFERKFIDFMLDFLWLDIYFMYRFIFRRIFFFIDKFDIYMSVMK